jgi:hypothetical protein
MGNDGLATEFQSRASGEIKAYRAAQADLVAKLVWLNDTLSTDTQQGQRQ